LTIRVAVWGPGSMGVIALRGVIDHPELKLTDLVVHSDAKAGRDAGELCGPDPGRRGRDHRSVRAARR
jgi:2,4-diaminopentanoate dehydrogenase